MERITVTFRIGDCEVAVETRPEEGQGLNDCLKPIMKEIAALDVPGKATAAQYRLFWARVHEAGLEKDEARERLRRRFGSAERRDLVGVVKREEFSACLDELAPPPPTPSSEGAETATEGQVRSLWAKALGKGWSRDQIREFLSRKIGVSRDEEIVGKIAAGEFSRLIEELAG